MKIGFHSFDPSKHKGYDPKGFDPTKSHGHHGHHGHHGKPPGSERWGDNTMGMPGMKPEKPSGT